MTERAPERIWSGIDIGKTIAGTLAAVSAAVIGSFLGVAGTLIGAAVASIVGSVGTEIYHRMVKQGSTKIKSTFVTAPAAVGTPAVAAAEDETPSQPEPEPKTPAKVRWGRVAAVAASFFVLAIGSLTVFELIAQRSIADAVGHSNGNRSTVGINLSGNSDRQEKPAPATSGESKAPAQDDATTEPTEAPSSTAPTPDATTDQPDPTTQPTDAPTTQAPEPTQDETQQQQDSSGGGGADEPATPGGAE